MLKIKIDIFISNTRYIVDYSLLIKVIEMRVEDNKIQMSNKLKIISFERESLSDPNPNKPISTSELSVNFLIFTPNKKLGFAERIIKEKQK